MIMIQRLKSHDMRMELPSSSRFSGNNLSLIHLRFQIPGCVQFISSFSKLLLVLYYIATVDDVAERKLRMCPHAECKGTNATPLPHPSSNVQLHRRVPRCSLCGLPFSNLIEAFMRA